MQFERGTLPNLEPIPQATSSFDECYDGGAGTMGVQQMARAFQRSESTGSIADYDNGLLSVRMSSATGPVAGVGKLPALLIPPKIAASLDNRELIGSNRVFISRALIEMATLQCPRECHRERTLDSHGKQMASREMVVEPLMTEQWTSKLIGHRFGSTR